VPLPGSGNTLGRFGALSAVASSDLSLARLVEGHLDALAILDEGGVPPDTDATYGVWAARSPVDPTRAELCNDGWILNGTKPFCSGASFLDRALITAETAGGYILFDVDLRHSPRTIDFGSWQAVGMAASDSQTIKFDDVLIPLGAQVGGPGFYLDRPGFWFGSSGVAACWFGGGSGLLASLVRDLDASSVSEHSLAGVGRAHARVESMRALFEAEAAEIDLDPVDSKGNAHQRSLILRQTVHDLCLDVLALTAQAGGARPLCHDAQQSRRAADLYVYLSQHHADRDAEQLGRILLEDSPWGS